MDTFQTPVSRPLRVVDVQIVEGCIVCGLCEDTCPQVFSVEAHASVVRSSAAHYYETHSEAIAQAARECPTDVIKVR